MYLLIALLLIGCTSQETHLIYLPEATPTSAPRYSPAPSREPEAIHVEPINGDGFKRDANGIPILNPLKHYYDFYLTVDDLRVYEENGETLVDAVITNDYPLAVTGGLCIEFRLDGRKYGFAEFYTDSDGLTLFPGKNRVYADVMTEVDVQMMDCFITVTRPFTEIPVQTPAPPGL